jgi:hypothetical protein
MTDRYFRCINEACRRKWHKQSIALLDSRQPPRTDLLSLPLEKRVGCPACGGGLVPEAGTFEEVIQEGRAP